ncbi:MAG: nitroreductase/quinone reductase family protein [Streptosporangiaceae bacterium]
MRSRKYRTITTIERPSNRVWRFLLLHGFAPRAFALLETTGRRTGIRRCTPVGNGLAGNTFWLVAAHGTQADYVRNLQANPQVRVKAGAGGARGRLSYCPATTRPPGLVRCRISGTRRSDERWPVPP